MEYKDYYKILGVDRDASTEDIKKAYRRLARKYHPDVSDDPNAEQRFKEIGEAYEVLKDPEKRKAYDQLGSGWQQGDEFRPPPGWESGDFGFRAGGFSGTGGFSTEDFSDFFESLFGGGFRPGGGRAGGARTGGAGFRARGSDQTASIELPLEVAYHGGIQSIRLSSGKSIQVRIPAGVTDGQRIRLPGQGEPGIGGGPSGDLHLQVHLREHPTFSVERRDIHLNLPVAPWEAALGATVKVPTMGGDVDLKVPAGSQSGRRLRLRGRGLPNNPAGDQYVTLLIVNPPMSDSRARELYEQMREELSFDPRKGLR